MHGSLLDMGGEGEPLLFAHANGYPPGAYRQMLARLGGHYHIHAIEQRPLWGDRQPPAGFNWHMLADDLLATMTEAFSGPIKVMGHSMGAVVAAIAARREPQRFSGLVLLDPVLLPSRWVLSTRVMPSRQRRRMPMIRRALTRPERFADHDEAFAFYRGKRAFRGFSDAALHDYIGASKAREANGELRLRYSGEWEAAVYASPPLARRALRGLRVPTLGLRGRDSDTLLPEMFARWARWQPGATLAEIPGGHLFPMENPTATADAILRELL
ncbi:MAG: alpha/beta hydrolase [Pseudomonadota bacterium]